MLFTPTAYTLKQGEVHLSLYSLFFPFITVGVTNDITMSFGTSLIPDTDARAVFMLPKFRILRQREFSLSCGMFYLYSFTNSDDNAGILFSNISHSWRKGIFNIGIGKGFNKDGFTDNLWVLIGGGITVERHFKLISDNIIISSAGGITSTGIRYFNKKISVELGFIFVFTDEVSLIPLIPWGSFTYKTHI